MLGIVEEKGFLVNKREIVARGSRLKHPPHHERRGGGERSEVTKREAEDHEGPWPKYQVYLGKRAGSKGVKRLGWSSLGMG